MAIEANPIDTKIDTAIQEVRELHEPVSAGFYIPIFGWLAALFYLPYLAWCRHSVLSILKELSVTFSYDQAKFGKIETCLSTHGIIVTKDEAQSKDRDRLTAAYKQKISTPEGKLQVDVSLFKIRVLHDLIEIFGQDLWYKNEPPFTALMVPFYLGLANLDEQFLPLIQNTDVVNLAIMILPDNPDAMNLKEACKEYPLEPGKVMKLKEKVAEWRAFLDRKENKKIRKALGHEESSSSSVSEAIISVTRGFVNMNEHFAGMIVGSLRMLNRYSQLDFGNVNKEHLFKIALLTSHHDDLEKNLVLFSLLLARNPNLFAEFLEKQHLMGAPQFIQESIQGILKLSEEQAQIFLEFLEKASEDWWTRYDAHQKNPQEYPSPEPLVELIESLVQAPVAPGF